MIDPPDGLITFLFTDIEGSTLLWEQRPDDMKIALAEHDELIRAIVAQTKGYVFTTAGDSFAVAYSSPDDAIAAARAIQLWLTEPTDTLRVSTRMGLHPGTAEHRDGDYFGSDVNRAARLMSAAHGGQILLSQAMVDLLPADIELVELGEHLLKDLLKSERIYQLLDPGLARNFPELRALEGPASNLPEALTSFVGREQELGEVTTLLASNRLVTLTGSGGAGKTRLAMQVAADARYHFPDGVRVVELAAVTDADVLVDETAQVFAVAGAADTPMIDTLVTAIGTRRSLLVLDNCEQLVAPVAALTTAMLERCPNIKIITTSRELLDVQGEVVYRVPSLSTPAPSEPHKALTPEAASTYDAVQLFVERALLAKPEFELTFANVGHVTAICNRLDGIPLAIELAAARSRVMSTDQIAERLDQRFLSVGTNVSSSSRHQTLQNAIDWSYNLLTERERLLFQGLSVFTGDFSLEAAEQVGGGAAIEVHDVAELLFDLVDKSIVAPEHGADGTTRYRLLESMRNYGLVQLESTGRTAALTELHLQYYTEFCRDLQAQERAGGLGAALAALDQNEDNLRAALQFSLDENIHEATARMIGSVGHLWYRAGLFREGIEWCSQLVDQEPELPDETRAAFLHAYGTLLGSWSQPDIGADILEQEVELRRRLRDPARLAAALNNYGNLLQDIGRFDEGEETLREAIEQFRLAGESPTLALSSLGYGYLHAGDLVEATSLYSDALEEALVVDDQFGIALATTHLGQCAALAGDLAQGRTLVEEARHRFEALNVTPGVANADFLLALIDRGEGKVPDCARRLLTSLSAPEAHWYLSTQYWIVQIVASIIQDPVTAATLLGVATAHYDQSNESQPTFVIVDLAETTDRIRDVLEPGDFERRLSAARRLDQPSAIGAAIGALNSLLAMPDENKGG